MNSHDHIRHNFGGYNNGTNNRNHYTSKSNNNTNNNSDSDKKKLYQIQNNKFVTNNAKYNTKIKMPPVSTIIIFNK